MCQASMFFKSYVYRCLGCNWQPGDGITSNGATWNYISHTCYCEKKAWYLSLPVASLLAVYLKKAT